VGSRQDAHRDDVDVLLDRGRDYLLGRLAESRVDDLHAGVPERARYDLGAAIMAVEARLRDEYPYLAFHGFHLKE